ncbi:hypothetical protein LguiA_000387 [Lonicera macranthoides]
MGRVKLAIKKIGSSSGRQSTYGKRKNGLFKKASELSILCDIDIVLLMFSPTGRPTLYTGESSALFRAKVLCSDGLNGTRHLCPCGDFCFCYNYCYFCCYHLRLEAFLVPLFFSTLEEIIGKFSQLTPQERAKRKLESLEALKRTYRKLDHDLNIQEFLDPCYQSVEDMTAEAIFLRTQLSELQKRLSYWTSIDKIDSVETLEQLEISLLTSLNQIHTDKVNHTVQQEMEIQSANKFQDRMHLPFSLALEEQLQHFSWIPTDHSQHMVLSKDPSLLPQRMIGYLPSFKAINSENMFALQSFNVCCQPFLLPGLSRESECSAVTSFGSYSGFFGPSEKVGITEIGEEHEFVNELSRTESFSLQQRKQHKQAQEQQHQYPSYDFGLQCDQIFPYPELINAEENTCEYDIDGRYEVPHSAHDDSGHSIWDSASGTCTAATFDEHLYPLASFSSVQYCLISGACFVILQLLTPSMLGVALLVTLRTTHVRKALDHMKGLSSEVLDSLFEGERRLQLYAASVEEDPPSTAEKDKQVDNIVVWGTTVAKMLCNKGEAGRRVNWCSVVSTTKVGSEDTQLEVKCQCQTLRDTATFLGYLHDRPRGVYMFGNCKYLDM